VKHAVKNQDKMIDEVVLKAFLECPVDTNDIDTLINQLGGTDNSLDAWKQKNSDQFIPNNNNMN